MEHGVEGTMRFRRGQVIVTACNRDSVFSRAIAASSGSPVTHGWIVTGPNRAVEATFPRIRAFDIDAKLRELAKHDQAYVVLDMRLGVKTRLDIATKAETYIGRWYDVGQILLYALTHKFWNDGSGTMVCSRLITAAYREAAGISLFTEEILDGIEEGVRKDNLRNGYATPADLLRSRLRIVAFNPSSRFPTLDALLSTIK